MVDSGYGKYLKIMGWKDWLIGESIDDSEEIHVGEDRGATSSEGDEARYDRPQILLLDLPDSVSEELVQKGYNVSRATLGQPYSVPESAYLHTVQAKPNLPHNYKEHDIVITDLHYEADGDQCGNSIKEVETGIDKWWTSHKRGFVNPRPLISDLIRDDFDRILSEGGVFVIFADRYEPYRYLWGHSTHRGGINVERELNTNNWSLLSLTFLENNLHVGSDHGTEIFPSDSLSEKVPLARLLSKHLRDAKYDCTLRSGTRTSDIWVSLLINKFGDSVGGAFALREEEGGLVLILPDVQDKESFLVELIDQVVPEIAPRLYPDLERASWIFRPEYELASVHSLRESIVKIREEAEDKVANLEAQIQEEKQKYSYLFDLIIESGDSLVAAVMETLAAIGFSDVIDADEEIAEQDSGGQKREDLRIHDLDPTLVVEVKGITGYPSDEDALTVQKYVVLRMKEWDRTSVQGLSIINHQRHLPPLDRENEMPFRQEILDAAQEQDIGLMTAWDLHRLARSYLQNEWEHRYVFDIFYKTGRIEPIPTHYEYVGTVERFIDDIGVVGIQVEEGSIPYGGKIAFELPAVFEEQVCDSMQFENEDIRRAEEGMLIGLKTHLSKEQAKTGTRVFLVSSPVMDSQAE